MGKLKELWGSFAPGVQALLTMVFLYIVIVSLLNVSLDRALFWTLLVTAFFFPAMISGAVEIAKMVWKKIASSFQKDGTQKDSGTVAEVKETVAEAKETVSEVVEEAAETVAEKVEDVADDVADAVKKD